jgi:hypothetical protein
MATPTFIIYDGERVDNEDREVISHSVKFHNWGLLFRDRGPNNQGFGPDAMIFQADGNPVMSIMIGSGNVGIGTPKDHDPTTRLEVDGDVLVTGEVHVNGNVRPTGDIFLTNADCAEDFDITAAEQIEPGTVMVINQEGVLQPGEHAYDKRAAGVIAGAGPYKSGLVLDRQPLQHNRLPVALVGKVYCKVDAQYGSIDVGDLLTTSPTLGHAMKASDPLKAFGAVIGKALRPLLAGQGLIPILIALQ